MIGMSWAVELKPPLLTLDIKSIPLACFSSKSFGIITITTGCDDSWAWIRVEDNGPGIEQDKLETIFQPFYTTKDIGTGLGLALSRSILEKHAGILEVKSSVGKGSCFTIKLPINS
jgi:two-component system NtrC family sensor kinase